ncbi:leucine rich protein, putative [Culex quinquefasciatus]|uniref:Leucine rich protein, putative n=1 Tax=Culex quinquefasciatus TaxID=7176 RepID=B0W4B9_CULQU|nr:leucine rich protein, putative [Culex quinquefasciatus]|eukprot:XP_001843561.1 leucine rich protein, putative [Culex quinquefasciatus]
MFRALFARPRGHWRPLALRSGVPIRAQTFASSAISSFHQNTISRLAPATTSFLPSRLYSVKTKPVRVRQTKAQVPLLDELKADALAYRRVQLDKLSQLLAAAGQPEPGSHEFLLGCCGRLLLDQPVEVRMQLFERLWEGGGGEPTLEAWKVRLRVYAENGIELEGVGGFLEGVKVGKDAEFYELLLGVVCERGDVRRMREVLAVCEAEGYGLTARLGALLIRGYGKVGDLAAVETVLDTMSAGNVALDEGVYGELIVGGLANGQTEKAVKGIKERGASLKEVHRIEALKEALLRKVGEATKLLVKLFPEDVLNDPSIDPVFRNLCTELLQLEQYETVRTLLNELPVPKFSLNENQDSYGVSIIFEMVKQNVPFPELIKMVNFLIKTERNSRALHVACDCAAKSRIELYPKLLEILREQEDLRPHYFWPLIAQSFTKHGESGVLDVLKLMQRTKTEADAETLSVFVLPKLSVTLKDVRLALKQFEDRGIRIATLMTPFVSHLLYQNRFEDVSRVTKLYPAKLNTESLIWPLVLQATVNKSTANFKSIAEVVRALQDKAQDPKHDLGGQLLMELISNKKSKHDQGSIKALLTQFERHQVQISRVCVNVLKTHFAKSKRIDAEVDRLLKVLQDEKLTLPSKELFDSIIVHPRDMTYDELECHLNELEEKNLNTRGVLRRLLQLCVRENRLDRAVIIKEKCDQARVELSSGMLASVFDLHIKRKNVDEAGKTLEQIRTAFPGFLVDDHKIIDYAALLAEKGFLSNVRKILKQRASAGLRPGNANRNIWNLLTKTAQWSAATEPTSDKNHTADLLNFLVDLNYCTHDNTLLGPVIREHLLKNQTQAALAEFKRIATQMRRTPLQLEIFTTLVKLTNSNDPQIPPDQAKALLSDLIAITSKIHGPVNTNNTLIVALADAGTEPQLRRILMNPETRVNHEYILTQCEFLVNAGKLNVVLRLAKCARGLANVREADFLAVIMKQYVRDNNCEAAVELFNRLQADDAELKISGDFARKLIDLLEVNSYDVPSEIRLYAK